MTPRETAIERITNAGGAWPLSTAYVPPWPGSGRYARRRCTECGHESRPMTAACELCGERLHEGH